MYQKRRNCKRHVEARERAIWGSCIHLFHYGVNNKRLEQKGLMTKNIQRRLKEQSGGAGLISLNEEERTNSRKMQRVRLKNNKLKSKERI